MKDISKKYIQYYDDINNLMKENKVSLANTKKEKASKLLNLINGVDNQLFTALEILGKSNDIKLRFNIDGFIRNYLPNIAYEI